MKSILLAVSIAAVLVPSSTAIAHPYYGYPGGCESCHGGYRTNPYKSTKGGTWPTSLHELHRSSTYMDADCNLCHIENGDRTSMTVSGVGYGCSNCHGNLHGGQPEGRGLREHHRKSGADDCAGAGCHSNPETALAESAEPPAYGIAGSKVDDPCNLAPGTLEDWSGDGWGLDNDGDLSYDGQDRDCGAASLPPAAEFTFTVEKCSSRVQFIDASTDPDAGDSVAEWSWDFGNDGTADATVASPVHDFPGPGTYPVKLTVKDGAGEIGSTVKDVAIAANLAPTAAFDVQVTDASAAFTDLSTDGDGTIASWQWAFGDGVTDASASPSHTYAGPGTYDVTLTVTDDCGEIAAANRAVTIAGTATAGFIRGDCNHDTHVDITDAVATLAFLFMGEQNVCPKACNSDDSSTLDLTDAVFTLTFLFLGGGTIPAPYPECGPDPTADEIVCDGATCP